MRKTTGLAIGLGVAAVGLGLVVGLIARKPKVDPCADAELAIGEVWTPSTRSAFKAREPATYFALEDYSARWRAVDKRSCEATRIDELADDATLEARRRCLGARLDELGVVLQRIQGPRPGGVLAVQLTAPLGAPEDCMDPPEGIVEARRSLIAAQLEAELGDFDAARASLAAIQGPPTAELALARGRVERRAGQAGPAKFALERAKAEGEVRLRVDACLELAAVAVDLETDAEAAKAALAEAQGILDTIDAPGPRRAQARAMGAMIAKLEGRRAEAQSELQAILDSAQSAGIGAWERALWQRELASLAEALGDQETAQRALAKARQLETGDLRAGPAATNEG